MALLAAALVRRMAVPQELVSFGLDSRTLRPERLQP
jgi:hypothetical protein